VSHYTFPADHDEGGHVAFPPVPSGKFLKDDGTWADAGKNVYIQNTAPVVAPGQTYMWIDTSDGDLNFWVEDGT